MFDGISAMEFVNSWAETARGLTLSVPPFLERSILKSREPPKIQFPHQEFKEIEYLSDSPNLNQEEIINGSFFFDPEKLQQLKRKAMEDRVLN